MPDNNTSQAPQAQLQFVYTGPVMYVDPSLTFGKRQVRVIATVYPGVILVTDPTTRQELFRLMMAEATVSRHFILQRLAITPKGGKTYAFYPGSNNNWGHEQKLTDRFKSLVDLFVETAAHDRFTAAAIWSVNPTQPFSASATEQAPAEKPISPYQYK